MRQGRTDIREVVLVFFGLVIGILVGLLVGPALRSWLVWREYVEAGREARLHEEILRRMAGPAATAAENERRTGRTRIP
jgi:hypothetical protein